MSEAFRIGFGGIHEAGFNSGHRLAHDSFLSREASASGPPWAPGDGIWDIDIVEVTLRLPDSVLRPGELGRVGRTAFSRRHCELQVYLELDAVHFAALPEAEFRSQWLHHAALAVEELVRQAHRRFKRGSLPVDPNEIAQRFGVLFAAYEAQSLPIPAPILEPQAPFQRDLSLYFSFPSRKERSRFMRAVSPHGFKIDCDAEGGRSWCTLTLQGESRLDPTLEAELIRECEAAGGEYDGWSA